MLATGHAIDRYVVEEKIGEGGMAVVYRVRHATLGTRHALKVLTLTSRDVRDRLIQEGRAQATLQHPNVVTVTDVLDVEGSPGLLMELVRGPPLDHWLYNYRPTLDESLAVFRGIVAGVGQAHAAGLIHRDLKSANIMLHLDERGIQPKVTDFGLAKFARQGDLKRTRTGTTMGTPAYMAPEQIRDASAVDRRADLYSLGCILYELVCGRTPFDDDDIIELFSKVAAGRYPHPHTIAPDTPDAVVHCMVALIEAERHLRLPDCASILAVLDGAPPEVYAGQPGDDEAPLPPPRPLPDPGITTLPLRGPAADAVRLFLPDTLTPVAPPVHREITTPPRAAPRLLPEEEPEVRTSVLPLTPPGAVGRQQVTRIAATGVAVALVAALITTSVGLLAGGAALYLRGSPAAQPTEVAASDPLPAVPEPPTAEPSAPPAPEPAIARATPAQPRPAAAPVVPAAAPEAPRPAPPGPALADPGSGLVRVEAEGLAVRLVDEQGKAHAPGQVPAGRYSVQVDFPEYPNTAAGRVTATAGQTSTVRCLQSALRCTTVAD